MTKTVDVDFRIRAKNLSKSTLADINKDLDTLAETQKKYASSAELSAASLKQLTDQQQYAAAALKELNRRSQLVGRLKEEQEEARRTAARLEELTRTYESLKARSSTDPGIAPLMRATGKAVEGTQKQLETLVASAGRTSSTLREMGVDASRGEAAFDELAASVGKAQAAYAESVSDINRFNGAVQRSADIAAEAQRRLSQEAAARSRGIGGNALASDTRSRELAALREDIELRSRSARQAEVQAEASRRLAGEAAEEASRRERNNAAIRESIARYDREKAARAGAAQAFGAELAQREREEAIIARSNARRDRLAAFLQTERGARILNAQALRQGGSAAAANAAAKDRNAQATDRAARSQRSFLAAGRESLSLYQRLRGQIIGLASAYVGIYEGINTVNKAIQATSRNQALQRGLEVGAGGDLDQAAKNYAFLRAEADRLGLVFDDVAPRFVNIDVVGRKAGLTAKQTAQAFTDLSTAAAARNLSIDDTEGAFRAIEQMFSKGRVQAEELRGQLAERLPGAVAIFAEANGIALNELDKMLEKGQVGLDFVVNGLRAYAGQFDSQIGAISERLDAYINRARNSYNDWLRTLIAGENQTRLKAAFKAVEDFFSSDDGKRFAESLGAAFGGLLEVLIWCAQNIDKVTAAIKLLIAVQAVMFVKNLSLGMIALAVDAGRAAKAILAARTAYVAAGTATATLSAQTRALGLAFGPVGIAITAITGGIFAYLNMLDRANEKTRQFVDTLYDLTYAQGVEGISSAISKSQGDIDNIDTQLKRLQELRDGLSGNPLRAAKAQYALSSEFEVAPTREGAMEATNKLLERQRVLIEGVELAEIKLGRAQAERAEEAAKAAREQSNIVKPNADKPKGEKGPSPEDLQMRLDSAQRQMERAALDLQDSILKTQMDSAARTDQQLERNHQLQLKRNQVEFEDEMEKLAALQAAGEKANRDAAKNGLPQVDYSAQITQIEGLILRQKQVRDTRAEEDLELNKILLKETKINELIEARDAKLQLINTQVELGMLGVVEGYQQANVVQEEYNAKIRDLIAQLMAILSTIDPSGGLAARMGFDQLVLRLQQANAEAAKLTNTQKFFRAWGQEISGGLANSFVELGKGIAGFLQGANSLSDAFKGAMDSFRTFAADFLQQIATMIAQAIILQAIKNAINGTSGGYGEAIGSALFGSGTGHTGGVVGSRRIGTNPMRSVNPAVFAGAQRFHSGGFPGLRQDEVPAVLKKGEEVVTQDDPRNALNGGAGGSGDVTIINTLDSAEIVRQGISGARRAILNDMRANANSYRQNLGIVSN